MLLKGIKSDDNTSKQLFLNNIGAELYGLISTLIIPS